MNKEIGISVGYQAEKQKIEEKTYTMQNFSDDIVGLIEQMKVLAKRPEVTTDIWSEFSHKCALSVSRLLESGVSEIMIREEVKTIFDRYRLHLKEYEWSPTMNQIFSQANRMLRHRQRCKREDR